MYFRRSLERTLITNRNGARKEEYLLSSETLTRMRSGVLILQYTQKY